MYNPRFYIPARTAAELLWLWPTVLHRAAHGQDLDFARKIELQALRPQWEPSPMQLDLMRRMVDHYAPEGIRIDPELSLSVHGLQIEPDDLPPSPCERCNADGAAFHAASGRMLCSTCASLNRGARK